MEEPGPPNPALVPTSLQEQRPCLSPPKPLHLPEPRVPQAAPGPLPHRSQLAALPPPQRPPRGGPRGRGLWRACVRDHSRAPVRAPSGVSAPSTSLCERPDSARLPVAGSAPWAPPLAGTTTGLAAAAHSSSVCPALGGSGSWEAAHGPGACAPRGPARRLLLGGGGPPARLQPSEPTKGLLPAMLSLSTAAPEPPHLTLSRPGEQSLGSCSWQPWALTAAPLLTGAPLLRDPAV